ncbi:hypothetical protein EK21DRAFT_88824 [Setomelanomma holmii]|uniref:RING-type domain-containing protein n=1 Tax=Setomelanomma holmii TaxID=210430 RepID=A0A9P4HBT7_9PLEO|nr:hypothetical protein EK21DRAFT_88824 [Setomelanomma holmii]
MSDWAASVEDASAEDWRYWLNVCKYYHDYCPLDKSPFAHTMRTFEVFRNSINDGLMRNDPEAVSLITEGLVLDLYKDLPHCHHPKLVDWLKDAKFKHPHRRTPKQQHFLAIVEAQARDEPKSIKGKMLAAAVELEYWKARVYAPENLVKDPDALYFFRCKNGLREDDSTPMQDGETPQNCLVCTSLFDKTLQKRMRAPCGHVLCQQCFERWLHECTTAFTCPMCRACVICGENGCIWHELHQDRATPIPMPVVLDRLLPEKVGEVLHGLAPERYRARREATRGDRALFEWVAEYLATNMVEQDNPIRVRLIQDADDAVARIMQAVRGAAKTH